MDKLTALIVEDDRDTAWFFKTVLDLGGFECENVFTAKDAFVMLTASVPDLILLDMRLPGDAAHLLPGAQIVIPDNGVQGHTVRCPFGGQ